MRPHVLTFGEPPSFNGLVTRVRGVVNVECELRLHGRYDMGSNRLIYVMLPLGFEEEWELYKSCGRESGLKDAEVVAEITRVPGCEITVHDTGVTTDEIVADPITMEQSTQGSGKVLLIGSYLVVSW
jgi:hypothetical protein